MQLENLNDVFHHELQDLYSAEKQLVTALPKMAKAASSKELVAAFKQHLDVTKEQVKRLETIASELDLDVKGEKCEGMEGLIEEGASLIEDNEAGPALDAALIAAAQRIEHYEMAGYGSAVAFAKELGHSRAAEQLQQTLDEEGRADKELEMIALDTVNQEAAAVPA